MKTAQNKTASHCKNCSFSRRIACLIYDGLIIAALWMLAALPVVIAYNGPIPAASFGFQLYLLIIAGLYFGWSWHHGGQTLGMRAWRVHLTTMRTDTSAHIEQQLTVPGYRACLMRYLTGFLSSISLGMGWLWALGHPDSLTWHDLMSKTRLVTKPKT